MVDILPPEFAWILPVIIPFLIGLLVGVVIKKTIKLIVVIIALLVILFAVGYIQFPSFEDMMVLTTEFLPKLWAEAQPLVNILPYSSATFLIGLAIGIWKG